MQQTNKSMFERAYQSHLEDRGSISRPKTQKKSSDLPLFYIALTLSVAVYVGLLVMAPSKVRFDDWFPNIMNPNTHAGEVAAGH